MVYPRLRELREDHDLNQTQVAAVLNMSQRGYSNYETGANDIPTHVLIQLSRSFFSVCAVFRIGRLAGTDVPTRER